MKTLEKATVAPPDAGTWSFDPAHTSVEFSGRYLMVSKVGGRFTDVSGALTVAEDPTQSSVEVTIQSASLTTAHADRDGHLKSPDFLDVEDFPTIEFVSRSVEGGGGSWQMTGDLTIKGVTRPVTFDVEYRGVVGDPWGGKRAAFSAKARIDRNDWGLSWNVGLETGGVLVGPKVDISIEAQGILQAA